MLTTQICFGQWVQVGLNDEVIKDIAVQNSTIFAVTLDSGKVYRSPDSGTNWTMIVDSCARDVEISPTGKVFLVKDSLIIGPYLRHAFYSVDNGDTWIWSNLREQLLDSITCFRWPEKITISPTGIIYCDINASDCNWGTVHLLARSTDDGLTWSTPGHDVNGGEIFDFRNNFVLTAGRWYIFLSSFSIVHLSSDYGISWSLLESNMEWAGNVLGLFTNGNIIMKSGFELFITIDMCSTWTKISSLNSQVGLSYSSVSTEGMLIGTDSFGVFLFSDEGDSLGSRNEGLTNLNVQALTLDNNGYVYAGTGNGVWRRPLSEVTPVEENQIEIPSSYNLSQNYPNPFNPSTKIKYSIPQSSNVVIKVFDILGNEIETLVNEEKSTGSYELSWNAANLPSGVYFYQLKAGDYTSVKKMILLR